MTFLWKQSKWQNPDKTEPIRMYWFCSRLKKHSWLWNTTCLICHCGLQNAISHDAIHISIQVPWYDKRYNTLTGEEELPRMDKPFVFSAGLQDCVSWQVHVIETAYFCDTILEDTCMWPAACKAKMDLFSPFSSPFV